MVERESRPILEDPYETNPFEIGGVDVPESSSSLEAIKKRILARFSQEKASDNEIADLLNIDTGDMTLSEVMEYAKGSVIYLDPGGRANEIREKRFRESKMVLAWLTKKEYRSVIKFFLEKAKKNWDGPPRRRDEDYFTVKIIDGADMATVPVDVALQGDTAIKEFIADRDWATTLKIASKNSATYLKQAAVLARLVDKVS